MFKFFLVLMDQKLWSFSWFFKFWKTFLAKMTLTQIYENTRLTLDAWRKNKFNKVNYNCNMELSIFIRSFYKLVKCIELTPKLISPIGAPSHSRFACLASLSLQQSSAQLAERTISCRKASIKSGNKKIQISVWEKHFRKSR